MKALTRRQWMRGGFGAAALGGGAAAVRWAQEAGLVPPDASGLYGPGHALTYAAQRWLAGDALAREFPRSEISAKPFANSKAPEIAEYTQQQAKGFADWRLEVDGMVARPRSFSLADLRAMPQRSQITALTCEEGWNYVAEWSGVRLDEVLREVGASAQAKFVFYFSLQPEWWDSVDIREAQHPQTILALGMNGGRIPEAHGGPLRMRVPRQLGYKSVKWIRRLTVSDSARGFGKGLGSAAAEFGYSWYNGI